MVEQQQLEPRSGFWRAVWANLFSWPTFLTVLCLLLLEGGLRLSDYPPPIEKAVLQVDPFLLWDMPPGVRSEQGVEVHVNSRGMRGPDFEVPKPSGRKRILAVGDSSVYGFGVEDSEVFSSVLADRMGAPVEVLNGAVGGYSTIQSLRFLYRNLSDIQPDLLLVANLWSDNNFDSFVDRELLEAYSGRTHPPTHGIYRMLSQSQLFKTLDYLLRYKQLKQEGHKLTWMPGHGKPDGRRRVELNDYAQNLDKMVQLAKAEGGETIFMILANKEDLDANGAPFKAWDPYRKAMRDTAERYGSYVLDIPALFQESKLQATDLFWDAMHPTVLGHKLIGEALAKALKERGWPEKPIMQHPQGGEIPAYSDSFLTAGLIKAVGAVIGSAVGVPSDRAEPPMPILPGAPPPQPIPPAPGPAGVAPVGPAPGDGLPVGPIPISALNPLPPADGSPGIPATTAASASPAAGSAAATGSSSSPSAPIGQGWVGSTVPGEPSFAPSAPISAPARSAASEPPPVSPRTAPPTPEPTPVSTPVPVRPSVKFSELKPAIRPVLRQGLPAAGPP